MSQPFSLNKYEKEKRVIELHLAGKTIREIAKELHMSFTPISKIIKAYERKKELQAKREESNQSSQPKKSPISTQAFKLFLDGKKLTDVAIDLEIPAEKAVKLWTQFLKLERMYQCYEFYKDYVNEIPRFLTINNFIKNNHVSIHNIVDILREAKNIHDLELRISILKYEIVRLQKIKDNLQDSQNNKTLNMLSEINWNYPKYHI
ncbi:MAG: helix-turn-helix domain-containing protein [Nitrososphaeraceae archaeon]|nr:helix-turn-helix domain-containing protein [Nitrososphaeraceae archaeon]